LIIVGDGEKSYVDILTIYFSFLRQYPSETILMSVDEESRFDDALGKFAPSRILCKLSVADVASCGKNTRSFEGTSFYWPEDQCFRSAAPPFYNIEDRYQRPGDDGKFSFAVDRIEKARCGDPNEL
jgi:hypothetical protein